MKLKKELAQQLRQSVQGCSQHLHGPVQAWHQLRQKFPDDFEKQKEVAILAVDESLEKIARLFKQGYGKDDPSVQKEIITADFLRSLYQISNG